MHVLSRRHALVASLLVLPLAVAACADAEPTGPAQPDLTEEKRDIERPVLSSVHNSAPELELCGPAVTYRLWAGRHWPGEVEVSNDARSLYVTYGVTRDGWYITDTRLAVAKSVRSIPLDHRRLPNPWAFPYSGVHVPAVKSFTYAIPLRDLGVAYGERVLIAAMAGVVHPKTADPAGPWEWIEAWGIGSFSGTSLENITNYEVAACPTGPEPEPPVSKGIITITFDDGWETTHTKAFPVLRAHGLRANVAVNPDPIDGGWATYMSLAQMRELHAAGWAVVSHGMSHRDLTTLPAGELERELEASRAWIERHGFRGGNVFIVPFHSWGERERAAVERHYDAARGLAANQFWPDRLVEVPITEPFGLTGFEPEFAPFTTAAGRAITREYLERAVREGEYIDIFFHKITDEQLPAFRELVRILAEYRDHVRTFDEVFPER